MAMEEATQTINALGQKRPIKQLLVIVNFQRGQNKAGILRKFLKIFCSGWFCTLQKKKKGTK